MESAVTAFSRPNFSAKYQITTATTYLKKPTFPKNTEIALTTPPLMAKNPPTLLICGATRENQGPLAAAVEFGETLAEIGGVEQKIRFFAFGLPHSDASFVQAYAEEATEASARATPRRSASSAACQTRSSTTTQGLP
jgi:hypothetical protein